MGEPLQARELSSQRRRPVELMDCGGWLALGALVRRLIFTKPAQPPLSTADAASAAAAADACIESDARASKATELRNAKLVLSESPAASTFYCVCAGMIAGQIIA